MRYSRSRVYPSLSLRTARRPYSTNRTNANFTSDTSGGYVYNDILYFYTLCIQCVCAPITPPRLLESFESFFPHTPFLSSRSAAAPSFRREHRILIIIIIIKHITRVVNALVRLLKRVCFDGGGEGEKKKRVYAHTRTHIVYH